MLKIAADEMKSVLKIIGKINLEMRTSTIDVPKTSGYSLWERDFIFSKPSFKFRLIMGIKAVPNPMAKVTVKGNSLPPYRNIANIALGV